MREGRIEMEVFRQATETLDRFEDFLLRATKFLPHRAEAHLRYSLTHSLKQTAEGGWTWKQDRRRRRVEQDPQRSCSASSNAACRRGRAAFRLGWPGRPPRAHRRSGHAGCVVAERVTREMADARLVVVPRAMHNDNLADFAQALGAFLSDVLER